MSGTNATVNIPNDVIEPIVRQQVIAGIIAQIGDPEKLIAGVVDRALKQKVGRDGNVSSSSYQNEHDLIETVSKNAIHSVTRQCIEEWVEEMKPKIQEQVKKALARKQSAFAKAMVDGMQEAMSQDWSFKCNITMPSDY